MIEKIIYFKKHYEIIKIKITYKVIKGYHNEITCNFINILEFIKNGIYFV